MLDRPCEPSMGMLAPLTQLARGEHKKTTTLATSSGDPKRPNGNSRFKKSAIPSGSVFRRRSQPPPGNRIDPGATAFTRTLSAASSRLSDLERLLRADFTAL